MDNWVYVVGLIVYAIFQIVTSLNKKTEIDPREDEPRRAPSSLERDPLEELLESFRKEVPPEQVPAPQPPTPPPVPAPLIRRVPPVLQPDPPVRPVPVRLEPEAEDRTMESAEREAERPLYANTVASYALQTRVEIDSAQETKSNPLLELTKVLHRRNAQAQRLRELLRQPAKVREAILLNEILCPPVALRV